MWDMRDNLASLGRDSAAVVCGLAVLVLVRRSGDLTGLGSVSRASSRRTAGFSPLKGLGVAFSTASIE